MWGDNSCLTNFGRVMALGNLNFYTFELVFLTPTSLHGFEWKVAGMLHHKSRCACGEILHVQQILAESWSLHGFEWKVAGMLHHKSRCACGEILHVGQILAELWSLTLRIFTHFSLSSQLLLHPCMDLNERWQGCYTTSLDVHVGRYFMFNKFWQSHGPWHLEFLHF